MPKPLATNEVMLLGETENVAKSNKEERRLFDRFIAQAERIGLAKLNAGAFAAQLAQRPEFADCAVPLGLAAEAGQCDVRISGAFE